MIPYVGSFDPVLIDSENEAKKCENSGKAFEWGGRENGEETSAWEELSGAAVWWRKSDWPIYEGKGPASVLLGQARVWLTTKSCLVLGGDFREGLSCSHDTITPRRVTSPWGSLPVHAMLDSKVTAVLGLCLRILDVTAGNLEENIVKAGI